MCMCSEVIKLREKERVRRFRVTRFAELACSDRGRGSALSKVQAWAAAPFADERALDFFAEDFAFAAFFGLPGAFGSFDFL